MGGGLEQGGGGRAGGPLMRAGGEGGGPSGRGGGGGLSGTEERSEAGSLFCTHILQQSCQIPLWPNLLWAAWIQESPSASFTWLRVVMFDA